MCHPQRRQHSGTTKDIEFRGHLAGPRRLGWNYELQSIPATPTAVWRTVSGTALLFLLQPQQERTAVALLTTPGRRSDAPWLTPACSETPAGIRAYWKQLRWRGTSPASGDRLWRADAWFHRAHWCTSSAHSQ